MYNIYINDLIYKKEIDLQMWKTSLELPEGKVRWVGADRE